MSAPGRIRCRLAELLTGLSCSMMATRNLPRRTHEITCDPSKLWPAQGAWRTDVRLDVMPWEGYVTVKTTWFGDGDPKTWVKNENICSWFTMTDLVKARLLETDYDCGYEVNPVEVSEKTAARTAFESARMRTRFARAFPPGLVG